MAFSIGGGFSSVNHFSQKEVGEIKKKMETTFMSMMFGCIAIPLIMQLVMEHDQMDWLTLLCRAGWGRTRQRIEKEMVPPSLLNVARKKWREKSNFY